MMMMRVTTILFFLATTTEAYQPSATKQPTTTRRGWLEKAALVAAATVTASPYSSLALEPCPKGSKNCIRTTWTPPSGTSSQSAVQTVLDVLNAYPQAGQQDIDKGGWTIISNDLSGSSKTAAVEYKSGIGNFAKFFNGGKPFVDDLTLELDNDGVVQVKSSSRIGESDLGVNQKRLQYLAASLGEKGWTVPEPSY